MTKARYGHVMAVGDRIRHVDGVWQITNLELIKARETNGNRCYLYTMRLIEELDGTPVTHIVEWCGRFNDLPRKFIDGDSE